LFDVQEEERLHYRFSSGQGRLPVIDEKKKNTLSAFQENILLLYRTLFR
jgi:hypothetical protein